ncbi:MAG TPA: HD domain-containing protein [bacterium]|nr:HD domain-containing protein [bacterium]
MEKSEKQKNIELQKEIQTLKENLEKAHQELDNTKKIIQSPLPQSEQKWQFIFDSMADAICLVDSNCKIIRCNMSMLNLFGKPSEQIIGKHFDLIKIDDNLHNSIKKLFQGFKQTTTQQYEIVKINQSYYKITLTPIAGEKQDESGALIIIRNITPLKEIEETLKESYTQLHRTLEGTVSALITTIEKRDPMTAGHEKRVAILGKAIALNMGMTDKQAEGILFAGMLHDIGKIAVPLKILNKPEKLDNSEYNLVKLHPLIGYEILKKVEFPWPIAEMILQHHERLNGSGYPKGLTKDGIISEAKILSVADVFEAMISNRPYRVAKSISEAISEIQQCNMLFDKKVIDVCVDLFTNKNFAFE